MTTTITHTATNEKRPYEVHEIRRCYYQTTVSAHSEEEAQAMVDQLDDQDWKYKEVFEERTITWISPKGTESPVPLLSDSDDASRHQPTDKSVYRVVATSYQAFHLFVEAESHDEAYGIGKSVDGFYWEPTGPNDWEVDSAEPAPNTPPEMLLPADVYNTL